MDKIKAESVRKYIDGILVRFEGYTFQIIERDCIRGMYLYSISVHNTYHLPDNHKAETFPFSFGPGLKEEMSNPEVMIKSFLESLYIGLINWEDFDGLGLEGLEAVKVYRDLESEVEKIGRLGMWELIKKYGKEE